MISVTQPPEVSPATLKVSFDNNKNTENESPAVKYTIQADTIAAPKLDDNKNGNSGVSEKSSDIIPPEVTGEANVVGELRVSADVMGTKFIARFIGYLSIYH